MDSHPSTTHRAQSVATLQIICAALAGSLFIYAVIAYLLVEVAEIGPAATGPVVGPLTSTILAALGVFLIPVGTFAGNGIRGRVERRRGEVSREEMLQAYTQSKVLSFVMYESGAVIGLLISLLTGEWIWAVALAAVSLVAMLLTWPRRASLDDWIRQFRVR